jgi:hypothetical protein
MGQEVITADGEVLSGIDAAEATSMVTGLAKAEIDQQIATAHKYPRSIALVVQNATSLATLSPDAAAEMNYALPRGGKTITGPSIRMAELIFSQWGNCRGGARVVHVDRVEKFLEAEGVFHDLQTNAATTKRVRRKISDKNGRLFNDDMITMAGNAACSIAFRNAILAGIPKAAWMPGYEAALKVMKGDAKTLTERREGALKALAAFGVTPDMIFAALDVGGLEDITLEHMPTMLGWHSGLKNEEQTVEQLFPRDGDGKPAPKGKGDGTMEGKLKDAVGAGDGDKKAAKKDDAKGDEKPADDSADQDAGPAPTGDDQQAGDADQKADDQQGDADLADPSEDDLTDARDRGEMAATKGRSRKSPPADVKAHPKLLEAWQGGFDDQKAAAADK